MGEVPLCREAVDPRYLNDSTNFIDLTIEVEIFFFFLINHLFYFIFFHVEANNFCWLLQAIP